MEPAWSWSILLGVPVVIAGLASSSAAQAATAPPAAPPASAGGTFTGFAVVILIVAMLVLVGVAVKLFDLRRRRQAEAVYLQAQVSDALLRDERLFAMPITPTARVPFWRGSPATLELTGRVGSTELHETALRLVRAEAARVRPDVEVADRLSVEPSARTRVA